MHSCTVTTHAQVLTCFFTKKDARIDGILAFKGNQDSVEILVSEVIQHKGTRIFLVFPNSVFQNQTLRDVLLLIFVAPCVYCYE